MSTVSPNLSQKIAKECADKGVKFLSATVFGRPDFASAAKLWICISGDREAKAPIEPLLHYLGQKIDDFGTDSRAASLVKVIGNFMIFATIELLSEGYICAQANGIDVHKLNDFFSSSLFACPVFKMYGGYIANKNFKPPTSRLALGQKDLNLFIKASESIDLPFRDILKKRIEQALDSGGRFDLSSLSTFTINEP
jgi:3-hydroxyisobutyrate dehydrogenase-like beta-hydroxyacid dehydrogenase